MSFSGLVLQLDSMLALWGGVSVNRRMVRMGVLSIILCSSSLTLSSTCGVAVDSGRCMIMLIFDWRSLMSCCTLAVALAMADDLANLSVSA